jgi:hypothetical protein
MKAMLTALLFLTLHACALDLEQRIVDPREASA